LIAEYERLCQDLDDKNEEIGSLQQTSPLKKKTKRKPEVIQQASPLQNNRVSNL
jgi:hypothetical protein